jgi:hypothetical protein
MSMGAHYHQFGPGIRGVLPQGRQRQNDRRLDWKHTSALSATISLEFSFREAALWPHAGRNAQVIPIGVAQSAISDLLTNG